MENAKQLELPIDIPIVPANAALPSPSELADMTATVQDETQSAPAKPLTRAMADYYCKQLFGNKSHIRYSPAWQFPYHVEMKRRGLTVAMLLGEGNTAREALLDAVKNTSPKRDVAGSQDAPAPEGK